MEPEDDNSTSSEELPDDSDNDSDSEAASDLEVDSEDEGMAKRGRNKKEFSGDDSDSDFSGDGDEPDMAKKGDEEEQISNAPKSADTKDECNAVIRKQEATRSLALELLDMDVGYSSDEGGDEDNAYYVSCYQSTVLSTNSYHPS